MESSIVCSQQDRASVPRTENKCLESNGDAHRNAPGRVILHHLLHQVYALSLQRREDP